MTIFQVITLAISLSALLISFFTLFKNRKTLTITWSTDIKPISPDVILFGEVSRPIDSKVCFYLNVDIVNPSPNDIAFFDLRAFNPETNMNYYLITKKSLPIDIRETPISLTYFNETFFLEIPDKNYGVFKSNSFAKLDLIIIPRNLTGEKLVISFKVADKNLISYDKFAVTNRKKYKLFQRVFGVMNWENHLIANDSDITHNNE